MSASIMTLSTTRCRSRSSSSWSRCRLRVSTGSRATAVALRGAGEVRGMWKEAEPLGAGSLGQRDRVFGRGVTEVGPVRNLGCRQLGIVDQQVGAVGQAQGDFVILAKSFRPGSELGGAVVRQV